MTNDAVAGERRRDLGKRRRVAEMSPEEMQRELLTSEVTGLPNRRAFDEAGAAPAVAMSDLDGLKALNKYGYEAGNEILRAKALALLEAGLDGYHDKGDEFLCRGVDASELRTSLERARAILRGKTIQLRRLDGTTLSIRGVDFSYGVGDDLEHAESFLRNHKTERERKGEIARGELRNITVTAHEPAPIPVTRHCSILAARCRRARTALDRTVRSITSVIHFAPKSIKLRLSRCNSFLDLS